MGAGKSSTEKGGMTTATHPEDTMQRKATNGSLASHSERESAVVEFQRRRLSLSQSTPVPQGEEDEEDARGMTEVVPNCISPKRHQRRRLSVTGVLTKDIQADFETKMQEVQSDHPTQDHTLADLGIGYACRKGLKPESPNQDDFFIIRVDDWSLYGVFDGHGPCGHNVSNFVQAQLPRMLRSDKLFDDNPCESMRKCFISVHDTLARTAADHNFDCSLSGTTASVVLHRPLQSKLFVAHVGDSRCVLGRREEPFSNGKRGAMKAIDITNDHKPNNPEEEKRIMASGGQVRRLEGDIPHRVFLRGKLYPGLAMSRAIGDTVGCHAGVIPEPDVSTYDLDETLDRYLILCSDGVWEFLTSQEVVDIVQEYGYNRVQEAAEFIARESWKRWIAEEVNVVDDITVEVICLYPDRSAAEE